MRAGEERREKRERKESDHAGVHDPMITTKQCPLSGRIPGQRDNLNILQFTFTSNFHHRFFVRFNVGFYYTVLYLFRANRLLARTAHKLQFDSKVRTFNTITRNRCKVAPRVTEMSTSARHVLVSEQTTPHTVNKCGLCSRCIIPCALGLEDTLLTRVHSLPAPPRKLSL